MAAPAASQPAEPVHWAPRAVMRLGAWPCGPVTLKAYGILADATRPLDEAVLSAAQAVTQGAAKNVAATAQQGAGFLILHRGREGLWLLLHWWLQGSICAQRLWRADVAGPPVFTEADRPLMACVWELALIDHERRAYVRTMMAREHDPQAYFADIYRPDFC